MSISTEHQALSVPWGLGMQQGAWQLIGKTEDVPYDIADRQ